MIFLFAVFRLKSLYGGAAVMLALFLLSFAVEARFAAEERSVALAYLPVLVFNGFVWFCRLRSRFPTEEAP